MNVSLGPNNMHKTIYLIRHGQARAGTADYDRLSPIGEQQAQILGRHFRQESRLPEEIWSGSLRRQQQSARHFLDGCGLELPIQTESRLNEYDHRAVHARFHPQSGSETDLEEDLPVNMSYRTYASIIGNWARHEQESNQLGRSPADSDFETWAQFKYRTINAMTEIAQASSASTIALFTSGGVISVIAGQLENCDDEHIPGLIWDLNNASVNTIGFSEGKATLTQLNDVQHLEIHSGSELVTKI